MTIWLLAGLSLFALGAFIAVLIRAYFRWLHTNFYEADASDEIHFVRTLDGARLALYRYRPQGGVRRAEPIFFVHGLGASKYNLDFDDTYSWARKFSREGYDAWVVDLRGAGLSLPPEKKWDWCFDHYARYDVTASIAHIREVTGCEKVHWIGHSMGGMLLYAYLGVGHPEWIRCGVAMGSPVRFASKRGLEKTLSLTWLLDHLPYVPIRTIIHLLLPLIPYMPRNPLVRSQMNPDNVDLFFLRRVAYNAVHHLPPALLKQFADWVEHDRFLDAECQFDYQQALRTNDQVPVFVLAGSGDTLVRPENAKYAYDLMPPGKHKYLEIGRTSGFSQDYGHIDFVFGKRANEEVFPLVLEWVNQHDPLPAQVPRAIAAG